MSAAGRKRDPVWSCFHQLPAGGIKGLGCRAKCKDCGTELQGLVARMKAHRAKCAGQSDEATASGLSLEAAENSTVAIGPQQAVSDSDDNSAMPSTSSTIDVGTTAATHPGGRIDVPVKTVRLDNFVTKTSKSEKEVFDTQIAKFIYATNSSFRIVEHPYFVRLIELLHPGYSPPSRLDISGRLLDAVHSTCLESSKEMLKGKTVCMSLDGWSNVHNEPVICATVTTPESEIFLVDTIDTSGKAHTADYLLEVALESINTCEKKFGCSVRSFVTDNAANVAKMRENLEHREDVDVITYGCSAHLMNLLAKDLEIPNIKEQVVQVVKYFRNNHFAAATYKANGGLRLIMPQEVRWNTMADCLESYIKYWPILLTICEQNRDKIDNNIANIVTNLGIKRSAEELLQRLKPIAVALDHIQQDKCTIADTVEIWKKLETDLAPVLTSRDTKQKWKKRVQQALSPHHFLANVMHPRHRGQSLTDAELDIAMELATTQHEQIVPDMINLKAQASPFMKYMFADSVLKAVQPVEWWVSQGGRLHPDTVSVAKQLLTATASSAGVERVFSSFGLVHSKLRNRLGIVTAGKLVFLFKQLNKKPLDTDEDLDQ